jgi:hypothetical protein
MRVNLVFRVGLYFLNSQELHPGSLRLAFALEVSAGAPHRLCAWVAGSKILENAFAFAVPQSIQGSI